MPDDTRHCAAGTGSSPDEPGTPHQACAGYDWPARHAAPVDPPAPLCDGCLTTAERDIRLLPLDWYDLAQLQAPTLSQAMDGNRTTGNRPMPLAGAPEALQAEILHVTTTWEGELRARHHLSTAAGRVRGGIAVQRAAATLAPRVGLLARVGPTAVYPTGCEDPPEDLSGVDAIWALRRLHQRARAMLGRTRRVFWVPGDCSYCGAADVPGVDGPLFRGEPLRERHEPPVTCGRCGRSRSYDDYQRYLARLVWPAMNGWRGSWAA